MRKQRYQRSVAENKSPQRVNTSTYEQDAKFLSTQLKALKSIWSEDEEKAAKKGKSHNAIAQDVKDFQNNSKKWSSSSTNMTEEELNSKFGGKSYQAVDSPLKLALEGSQVELAASMESELINKYSEEEYSQFIAYANENQPVVDKSLAVKKYASGVDAKDYTDSYFSDRKMNLNDYMTPEEVTKLHVDKYTQKVEDFINSTPLTDANIAQVTKTLSEKIDAANLPKLKKVALKSTFSRNVTKFKDDKLKQFNAESDRIESAYLSGKISRISDYSQLNDSGAKTVGNAMFAKKSQQLKDGSLSFSRFNKLPQGKRAGGAYQSKLNRYIESEYESLKNVAASTKNEWLIRRVDSLPVDRALAVELTYNYYNERKRDNPDFTLDDAKDELYSSKSKKQIQQLLEYSHRDYLDVVKDRSEYIELMKTTSGRMEFRRKAAMVGKSYAAPSLLPEEYNGITRQNQSNATTY